MKQIKLTEDQKGRSLEMCNYLFIENLFIKDCYCDDDQGGGYTFNDEYGDCDFCKESFFQFYDNSVHFDDGEKKVNINWFEFCMTHLFKKIFGDTDSNKYSKGALATTDYEYSMIAMFENHPVDYLYEQFKKIQL